MAACPFAVRMPIRALQRRIAGNENVSQILVSVQDGISTSAVAGDITRLMRERRHLADSEQGNFRVTDMTQISNMLTGTTETLTALLSAVAAVSLLVGGIGIMNIMLVSVTERTREIGIRLAVGAMETDVLLQFLVEAVALSSFGGFLGIALAMITSYVLAARLEVPFVVDATTIGVAFLFSSAVGMIFGYFPARKAARLDPIEALRHE
jgi:putative ABC transport system permease protein